MKKALVKIINRFNKLTNYKYLRKFYSDISEQEFWDIYIFCCPYTMTSVERMYSLYTAVDYVLVNKIEGVFVECGVWRGGSAMLIAKMLSNRGISDRKLYLYDTFEGMAKPTSNDGKLANTSYDEIPNWCLADLNDVTSNMQKTNYNEKNFVYVKGKIEDTLPSDKPAEKIALLRLDTDWYESTKHELIHLFPTLVENGVLIIDDYGYWEGCRKAVDEYFKENKLSYYFNRIDSTGRIIIKTNKH